MPRTKQHQMSQQAQPLHHAAAALVDRLLKLCSDEAMGLYRSVAAGWRNSALQAHLSSGAQSAHGAHAQHSALLRNFTQPKPPHEEVTAAFHAISNC